MEILNEFDEYVAALKKVDINEEVMPYVRGKLLTENVELYAKIQKLLGCKAFEPCHRFLYDLDIENIDESEASKVNNLYQLGLERGFIVDEQPDGKEDAVEDVETATIVQTPAKSQPQNFVQAPSQSAYTILYSAIRDGQLKTGEAFSNAINTRSAKADVISKLERAGYSNIAVLAIEAGDPDMQGCNNTFCKQANEADVREPLSHAFDPYGVKASTANTAEQDAVSMFIVEKDKDNEASEEKDSSKEEKDDSKQDDEDTGPVDTAADAKAADDASDDSDANDAEDADTKEPEDNKEKEDKEEDKKDDSGEDDEESSKELSIAEKATLKDSYKKAFKAAMLKLKFEDKCFDDLTLEEKVDFFTEMSNTWKDKADPKDFMTSKEVEALEKLVIKK